MSTLAWTVIGIMGLVIAGLSIALVVFYKMFSNSFAVQLRW